MADFAAILEKALDKMGETTPETRAKVYEKARQTVRRQIDAMAERPPQAAIDRQFAKLEDAIAETEARYAEAEPATQGAGADDSSDADEAADALFGHGRNEPGAPGLYAEPAIGAAGVPDPPRVDVAGEMPVAANDADETEKSGGGLGWLLPTLGALALIAAIAVGYFIFVVQGGDGIETATGSQPATETAADGAGPARTVEPVEPTEPVTETVDAGRNGETVEKFTQRLTEDGREIDEGPAEGSTSVGEGSSVAGQTALLDNDAQSQGQTGEADIPVGQRTIFYEERTSTEAGTAMQGATIWSVSQESPGGDLPLEPAIKAESTIPDLGLNLELTIRRNGDGTFPASHIIELFFTVPETFDGRGIADVQRITFKDTEQDPGSALIAVPAPLDTNIFLIALTDAQTAVDTNVALMRSQGWIDIPMQYVTGRRALITLEKGIAGERVFTEVFNAWQENPLPDG
ncbi:MULTISPECIES: hypothetical protein [unclassified Roseitalea]|uniref:hypothetical protein n=1 Tax=unclassified Roseitalea TaxID=2639107 RepID=UPI00273FACE6|nr:MULTISPECIES: hypothetical protein [unclassified Roseitalea]